MLATFGIWNHLDIYIFVCTTARIKNTTIFAVEKPRRCSLQGELNWDACLCTLAAARPWTPITTLNRHRPMSPRLCRSDALLLLSANEVLTYELSSGRTEDFFEVYRCINLNIWEGCLGKGYSFQ